MDSEAHYFEEDEDLEMIIERQGDINEEEDDENRRPAGSDDEAQEAPSRKKKDDEKDDETKKKRVLAPRPKLDPVRLMGPRGLLALQAEMKEVKLKGRGHELQDLDLIIGRMQHWAHRLFPSYTFDDCLEKLEKLGSKKNVMVQMKRIRMGLVSADDIHDTTIRGDDYVDEPPEANNDNDNFDNLMSSARGPSPPPAVTQPPPTQPQTISDEQRERMIRNRMVAEERKLERLKKQQEEEQRLREEEENAAVSS